MDEYGLIGSDEDEEDSSGSDMAGPDDVNGAGADAGLSDSSVDAVQDEESSGSDMMGSDDLSGAEADAVLSDASGDVQDEESSGSDMMGSDDLSGAEADAVLPDAIGNAVNEMESGCIDTGDHMQTIEVVIQTPEPVLLWDSNINEYNVTDGLLLCILVVLMFDVFLRCIRR